MKRLVNWMISITLTLFYSCVFLLAGSAQNYEQNSRQTNDDLNDSLRTNIFRKDESNAKDEFNSKDESNSAEILPQIPPPLAVSLPMPASVAVKPAAASEWRCRAFALANEYPLKKNSTAWTLPVTYKQGQFLIKQALTQMGLVLLSEYDDAGQFLISSAETNKKGDVIIVSQPVGETSTLFKMHVYDRLVDAKKIDCLPDTMRSLIENRGLWQ